MILRVLVLLLLAQVVASPALATTRFFLGIGSSEGKGEPPLRWARGDATKVRDVFTDLGGVHPSRAILLLDPSAEEVEHALIRLQGNVEEAVRQGERVELVVHYAGHGDSKALRIKGTRLAIDDLERSLGRIPASATIVIVDACRTEARPRGASVGPRFDGALVRAPAPEGMVLLFSAREGEVAQESDALEGAFFTHALLAGLRGAADLDGDRRVTLAEAWRRSHAATLAQTHAAARTQHPEMTVELEGEGELVLTELERARATVVLDESIRGSVLLLDARSGRVLLEVEKHDARPVTLAVPPGRLGLQVRPKPDGDAYRGEISLEWGGSERVGLSALSRAPRIAAAERGGGDVDVTPFTLSATGGAFASPYGLPGWTGALALERRVFEWPLLIGLSVDAGYSEAQGERWRFQHGVASAMLLTTAELYLGPVRFFGGAEAGARGYVQRGQRKDAAYLEARLGQSPTVDGWALAPALGLRAGGSVPLLLGFRLLVLGRTSAALATVDAGEGPALSLIPRADLLGGIECEF